MTLSLRASFAPLAALAVAALPAARDLGAQQQPAQVVVTAPTPQLVTSGRGETRIAPDRATVTVTVVTQAATAAAAGAANARQTTSTTAALRAAGLAPEDISTMGYSVNPDYQYAPNTKPKITGYTARNTVRAEVKRIDQTGKVIDAALAGGANEIGGVEFRASNVDAARRESLAKAVALACGDAAAMARAVGANAGQAIELSTMFEAPPRPMMEVQMMSARAAQADVPTPITPGEFVVAATVTARWPLLYGAGTPARCQ
jgi:uncharacterized protein YggE